MFSGNDAASGQRLETIVGQVTYTSAQTTGSLAYTPVADASGSATITVTDVGGASTSETFEITVNSVNDLPTLDTIDDPAAIAEDASQQTVNLSGITAGGGESQALTVTASSNNTALIPNPVVSRRAGQPGPSPYRDPTERLVLGKFLQDRVRPPSRTWWGRQLSPLSLGDRRRAAARPNAGHSARGT